MKNQRGQASRINIRFKMITEDQLEQLEIQWFQDTGGENIEHRTLNIDLRSEEKRRLVEEVVS